MRRDSSRRLPGGTRSAEAVHIDFKESTACSQRFTAISPGSALFPVYFEAREPVAVVGDSKAERSGQPFHRALRQPEDAPTPALLGLLVSPSISTPENSNGLALLLFQIAPDSRIGFELSGSASSAFPAPVPDTVGFVLRIAGRPKLALNCQAQTSLPSCSGAGHRWLRFANRRTAEIGFELSGSGIPAFLAPVPDTRWLRFANRRTAEIGFELSGSGSSAFPAPVPDTVGFVLRIAGLPNWLRIVRLRHPCLPGPSAGYPLASFCKTPGRRNWLRIALPYPGAGAVVGSQFVEMTITPNGPSSVWNPSR